MSDTSSATIRHARTLTWTVSQIAERYQCSGDKVLGWIHRGELRAINLANNPGGRPRWRIDHADLLAFESRRAAQSPAPARRREKKATEVISYF